MTNTTIQISHDLKSQLDKMKFLDRETYEDLIWDLLEDRMELTEQTKKDLEIARKQIENGETFSLEEVEKEFGL